MIRFARRVRDIALLIRDLPEVLGLQLELEAEDLKAREACAEQLREIQEDLTDLREDLNRLDAITHELYIGPKEEVPRDA